MIWSLFVIIRPSRSGPYLIHLYFVSSVQIKLTSTLL